MSITEDAGRFPFPGAVPPDDQELGFAKTLVGLQVAELVPALLALMPATASERRSLNPFSTICRTSSRRAGALTTFFAGRP